MSALALTLLRVGFLALLWFFVLLVATVLRRDLSAPAETPLAGADSAPGGVPPARSSRTLRSSRTRNRASTLVVVQGSLEGTVLPLGTEPILIGRAPDCTLVLSDDYSSGHHARLYQMEGNWVVEDLGSTNGTWIDRGRITSPTVLEIGMPLRVGRTVLELRK